MRTVPQTRSISVRTMVPEYAGLTSRYYRPHSGDTTPHPEDSVPTSRPVLDWRIASELFPQVSYDPRSGSRRGRRGDLISTAVSGAASRTRSVVASCPNPPNMTVHITVIAITGGKRGPDALVAGRHSVLQKPFGVEDLAGAITRALQRTNLQPDSSDWWLTCAYDYTLI